MRFLTEPEPARRQLLPVLPGIGRMVAANASVMTYHGTNTYLIDGDKGWTVIDPGPIEDTAHLDAIILATSGRVATILVTHTHRDHLGLAPALRMATGAPLAAFSPPTDSDVSFDIEVHDGDEVAGMRALHTPGHALDHLCFARPDGVVFTGDHIMGWSSTVVSPPRGDMVAYFASVARMIARDDTLYLPGHGPPLEHPREYVKRLLHKRQERERAILARLAGGALDTTEIVDALYSKSHPRLKQAAERNVTAHLFKLLNEGRVRQEGGRWRTT